MARLRTPRTACTPSFWLASLFTLLLSQAGAAQVNQAPEITAPASIQRDPGELVLFNVQTRDPDGDGVTLAAADVPPAARFLTDGNGNASFVWTPTDADTGVYPVTLHATDDGTPMRVATAVVEIVVGDPNRPPVLAPVGDQEATVGQRLEVSLEATDPEGDPLVFRTDPVLDGSLVVPGAYGQATFVYTPDDRAVGNQVVRFVVSDGGSVDDETVVISVGDVNVPPVLNPIGDRMVDVGSRLEIALTASDADGDGLAFEFEGLPADFEATDHGDGTATIRGTPSQAGIHDLVVRVRDDGVPPEAASEAFVLEIRELPRAETPVLLDVSWQGGLLTVVGEGAPPGALVELRDPATGAVLGTTVAEEHGLYAVTLEPTIPPCRLEALVGDTTSDAVDVAGAPKACSRPPDARVWRAFWSCRGRLLVLGLGAPPGSTLRAYDPSSEKPLATARASRRGTFLLWGKAPERPDPLTVTLEADGIEWPLDPVKLRSLGRCSRDWQGNKRWKSRDRERDCRDDRGRDRD